MKCAHGPPSLPSLRGRQIGTRLVWEDSSTGSIHRPATASHCKGQICIQSPPTMLNEVECMAHPSGIDQRRELYPLSFLSREISTLNDLAPELSRRKLPTWGAFKSIRDIVKKTRSTRLRAHLFDSTGLPALMYPSEIWWLRKQYKRFTCITCSPVDRRVTRAGASKSSIFPYRGQE